MTSKVNRAKVIGVHTAGGGRIERRKVTVSKKLEVTSEESGLDSYETYYIRSWFWMEENEQVLLKRVFASVVTCRLDKGELSQ